LWLAIQDDQIVGLIALDRRHGEQAHLRWFILDPAMQGQVVGRHLLGALLQFSDSQAVLLIYLNIFAGLDAARRLDEQAGFVLTQQQTDTTWGVPVEEQRFERVPPSVSSRS
jgi:RimJ/RimL family protein N-acetyltransferase